MKRWRTLALAAAIIVPALSCGQRSLVLLDVKASNTFTDPTVLLDVGLVVTANRDVSTRFSPVRLQTERAYQIGMYLPSDMSGTVSFEAKVDNGNCILGTGTAVATGVQSGETSSVIEIVINKTSECIPIGDGGPSGAAGSGGTGMTGSAGAAGSGVAGAGGSGGLTGAGGVTGAAGATGAGGVTGNAGSGPGGTTGVGGVTGSGGTTGTAGIGGTTGTAGRGGTTGTAGIGGTTGTAGHGGTTGTAGIGGVTGTAGRGGTTGAGGTGLVGSGGTGGTGPVGSGGTGGINPVGTGGTGAGPGSGGASAGIGGTTGLGGRGGTTGAGGASGGTTGCGATACVPPYVCSGGGTCICSESDAQACLRAGVACGWVITNCGAQVFCSCPFAGQVCDTNQNKCFSGCTTGTGGIITTEIICPVGTD